MIIKIESGEVSTNDGTFGMARDGNGQFPVLHIKNKTIESGAIVGQTTADERSKAE